MQSTTTWCGPQLDSVLASPDSGRIIGSNGWCLGDQLFGAAIGASVGAMLQWACRLRAAPVRSYSLWAVRKVGENGTRRTLIEFDQNSGSCTWTTVLGRVSPFVELAGAEMSRESIQPNHKPWLRDPGRERIGAMSFAEIAHSRCSVANPPGMVIVTARHTNLLSTAKRRGGSSPVASVEFGCQTRKE
jgi:hypothetical protein